MCATGVGCRPYGVDDGEILTHGYMPPQAVDGYELRGPFANWSLSDPWRPWGQQNLGQDDSRRKAVLCTGRPCIRYAFYRVPLVPREAQPAAGAPQVRQATRLQHHVGGWAHSGALIISGEDRPLGCVNEGGDGRWYECEPPPAWFKTQSLELKHDVRRSASFGTCLPRYPRSTATRAPILGIIFAAPVQKEVNATERASLRWHANAALETLRWHANGAPKPSTPLDERVHGELQGLGHMDGGARLHVLTVHDLGSGPVAI